ncbi:hypothetical protein F5B21DRAFT_431827 [Xylaria acuta]|nr:hypothetical protein F5B21DRAFT_431827 [Xylaria acuta]
MDEPTSVQPLTEENMKKLRVWQIAKFLPTESLATSDFLPIDRLEKAKCRVYKFLSRLKDIGDEGIRIREAEAVYLGTAVAESDLQDHSFWEAKLENLEQTYGPGIKITRAKRAVCHYMRLLHKFGPEGRKILADHELCLVGKDDVCYRGSADPEPDLQDPTYWVAQKEDLWSKHQVLWRARYPPPPTVVYIPPNTEERMKSVEQENLVEKDDSSMALRWAWARRKRMIRAWVSELIGASLSGSESPIFYDPPDQTTAGDIEDSISYRSAELPYFRWHDAYRGVYERMAALWHLGGEGCEIVANDELRVVDKYDVRYRRSRGPKPNLKDPRYWEAKWEYFTDKYISLLQSTTLKF